MYKNIIITISILLLTVVFVFSQNHIEALRYSQQFYSSTAKAEAMGNSLSAVGADFSAYMINPAGIAIFKQNQLAFTPNFIISKTKGTLSGNMSKDGRIGFNFSNAGYVGVHKTNGIVKAFNLGIAYNSFNDFRQQVNVSAENQNSSFLDYTVYNANNDRYSDYREELAYQTYLLEKDNEGYYSEVTYAGKYGNSQRKTIRTNGAGGEFSFTLGANINDILYLGGTIGLTSINYTYTSTLSENNFIDIYKPLIDNPADSSQVDPNNFKYSENLNTEGSGINAKFGFIFQPIKFIRLGGAIHSSTAYDFTELYSASMDSEFPEPDNNGDYSYHYENEQDNAFEYRLKTPLRANLGLAVILDAYEVGKFYSIPMIFSVDYEYVDYSRAYLKSGINDSYDFISENINIKNFYKETHNIRAGAELNFGKIKIRGGYAIYSNPFSNAEVFKNAKVTYSGGIGFASRHSYIDFSYSFSPTTETLNLYNAADVFPSNPIGNLVEPTASLSNTKQFFKLTFGLRL